MQITSFYRDEENAVIAVCELKEFKLTPAFVGECKPDVGGFLVLNAEGEVVGYSKDAPESTEEIVETE